MLRNHHKRVFERGHGPQGAHFSRQALQSWAEGGDLSQAALKREKITVFCFSHYMWGGEKLHTAYISAHNGDYITVAQNK